MALLVGLIGLLVDERDACSYLADGFGADEPDITEVGVRHVAKVFDREPRTAQGVEDAAAKSERPQLFFPRPGSQHPVGVYA